MGNITGAMMRAALYVNVTRTCSDLLPSRYGMHQTASKTFYQACNTAARFVGDDFFSLFYLTTNSASVGTLLSCHLLRVYFL